MRLYIGTPLHEFMLTMDSRSTVTYIPCATCEQCGNHQVLGMICSNYPLCFIWLELWSGTYSQPAKKLLIDIACLHFKMESTYSSVAGEMKIASPPTTPSHVKLNCLQKQNYRLEILALSCTCNSWQKKDQMFDFHMIQDLITTVLASKYNVDHFQMNHMHELSNDQQLVFWDCAEERKYRPFFRSPG